MEREQEKIESCQGIELKLSYLTRTELHELLMIEPLESLLLIRRYLTIIPRARVESPHIHSIGKTLSGKKH